jgi:molybdate transport system substrate-binding protein
LKPRILSLLAVLALLPVAGCSSDDTPDRTLTVLAASSLTGTFTELAQDFEDSHPGVTVKLAFDSSATLAQQAIDGAPADVLATADLETMQAAQDGDALDGESQVFATNTMVLVTPATNPAGLTSFADLQQAGVTYVACVDTAPCGKVAALLFDDNGITHPPASLEPDVKAVLAKVTGDEADAGLVYATDAVAAGDQVTVLPVPGSADRITTYPVAALAQAGDPDLAAEFVALVTGDQGQQILSDAGFGKP